MSGDLVLMLVALCFIPFGWWGSKHQQRIARYREWEEKMIAEEKERDQRAALEREIAER